MSKKGGRLAKQYARALFELCDKSQLEELQQSLTDFADAWIESADLRSVMLNPAIQEQDREKVIREVASKIRGGDKNFENFAALLSANKRISLLPAIAEEFAALVAALKEILNLEIASAFEVPASEREEVAQKLNSDFGSLANIEWKTDPALLGGLQIKSGDRLLDGSISGSLEKLRSQLLG